MIPAPFTYQRAGSVDEALSLAAQGGEDAKFLAGGHSLLPLMKLRLAVPEVLVDIGRLSELSYVREENGHIAVGALTTHHDVANSGLLGGELLTEIRIPRPAQAGWSFQKFTKRAIDWAIVGAAVQGDQVALIHMGSTPLRAGAVEQALAGGAAPADAAAHAAEGTSPPEDINADREYREHLARVLVARGLAESRSRA